MVGGGVPDGGIGVRSAPGQDGSAVDDEITAARHAPAHRQAHHDHQQRLGDRRSRSCRPLPLLCGSRHAGPAVYVAW
jgi:hypothetical protein